jgi:Domain of unknown function (DUF2804), C-terminal/Domain of unknown function (DUF2804), N-terminal
MAHATPFPEPGHFFYENKIFAMPVTGEFSIGEDDFIIDESDAFAVLDWGRGVWPEEFEWSWGVAAGYIDGRRIGFNVGLDDGDETQATSNVILVDGIIHKLCRVDWKYDEDNIMEPWKFSSGDGKFDMTLVPFIDQSTYLDAGIYYVKMNKVLGRVSGVMTLDNGEVIEVENIQMFAEHAFQKW